MFFDEVDSVMKIDCSQLKPHYWRGPTHQTFQSLLNPKAPGPFTISFSNGAFEHGRNMWGGRILGDGIDPALGNSYMLKAAKILGLALDQSEKNAAKMRQKAIRENEEWALRQRNFTAHSVHVPENLLPHDASLHISF